MTSFNANDYPPEGDLFEALRSSSWQLRARFGTEAAIEPAMRQMMEEATELTIAATHQMVVGGPRAEHHHKTAVAQEAADLLVTVGQLLDACGVTSHQLRVAVEAVVAKNAAKTPATHHVVRGKITRHD